MWTVRHYWIWVNRHCQESNRFVNHLLYVKMKGWHLKNKKALVTGGTKGIGRAVVEELLLLGAEVLFIAREITEINTVLESLKSAESLVYGLQADVNSIEERTVIEKWIRKKWGKLDILVNNAGLNIRKPSIDYGVDEYQKVLNTDLVAPFEMCRLLYELLAASRNASVINVASVAGIMDAGTGAPYAMAKSGLIQMSRNLAVEWASWGIRVNAVSPWFTRTPATSGVLSDKKMEEAIVLRTPLGRVAAAEEVASVVAFLAMDKASYITGQHYLVDGGATSKIL